MRCEAMRIALVRGLFYRSTDRWQCAVDCFYELIARRRRCTVVVLVHALCQLGWHRVIVFIIKCDVSYVQSRTTQTVA